MSAPAFSVVLPFRNAFPFITDAVASVCSQLNDGELVLVDDGSTDGSETYARRLADLDVRVRYVQNERRGIVQALNAGVALSRAPLIGRMDADDICLPGRFRRQADFLRHHPDIAAVSCRVEPFAKQEIREGSRRYLAWVNESSRPDEIARDLFVESPLPHPSMMIRRACLHEVDGYRDFDGPEDYDLWLRMADRGMHFAKLPDVLLRWRIHEASLSRKDLRYRKEAFDALRFDYLASRVTAGEVLGGRELWIWGAGKVGAKLRSRLEQRGLMARGFFDVDPAKVASLRAGKPVRHYRDIPGCGSNTGIICCVGNWEVRNKMRAYLLENGLREGERFVVM